MVGMAATTEKEKMLATIDYTLQPGRHEEVVGLEQLVVTMLERYGRAHGGRLPSRLIIYRDGVSEGEYRMCLSSELPRIRSAYEATADRMKQNKKVGGGSLGNVRTRSRISVDFEISFSVSEKF